MVWEHPCSAWSSGAERSEEEEFEVLLKGLLQDLSPVVQEVTLQSGEQLPEPQDFTSVWLFACCISSCDLCVTASPGTLQILSSFKKPCLHPGLKT